MLGLRKAGLSGVVSPECRGMGLGVGKLGSQYWFCAAFLSGCMFMLKRGGGKWLQPVPLSLETCLCELCLSGVHSKKNE